MLHLSGAQQLAQSDSQSHKAVFPRHEGQDASLKPAETGPFSQFLELQVLQHVSSVPEESRDCLAVTSALICHQGLSLPDQFFLFCYIIKANFEISALLIYVLSTALFTVVDSSTINLKTYLLKLLETYMIA